MLGLSARGPPRSTLHGAGRVARTARPGLVRCRQAGSTQEVMGGENHTVPRGPAVPWAQAPGPGQGPEWMGPWLLPF